jgi:cytochrome c
MGRSTQPYRERRRFVQGSLAAVAALMLACASAHAATTGQAPYGFGATPSPAEMERFVSPLPDGRGLPSGSGSVEQGKALYEQPCVACHGPTSKAASATS